MIAKKYLLLLIILPILMLSLATINMPVQAKADYVKIWVAPTVYPYIEPGLPRGASRFTIDIMIEVGPGLVWPDPEGIVGWGIYFRVNPAVLELLGQYPGAMSGYFLWQAADLEGWPYPSVTAYTDATTGFADVSEQISPTPEYGADDYYNGYKLISIKVESLSDTIPCLLDIYNAEYMTSDGSWHQIEMIVDGWYGAVGGFQSEITGAYSPTQPPIGTTWHELYPNPSHMWEIIDWADNTDGKLSASDQIEMVNETGWVYPFHVDAVTTTIHWTFKPSEPEPPAGDPAHAEPDESLPLRVEGFMENPLGSYWHQIYPDYSRQFKITSWIDNGDGTFGASDQFDFEYEDEPGVPYWAHLDAVTTDIIISQKGDPWPEPVPEFPLGMALMIAIAPAIPILYLWRLRKKVVAK